MIDVPVYPLQWPDNVRRNSVPSGNRPFKTTLNTAIGNVRVSLQRFGKDTGMAIADDDIVFSSNFGGVGLEVKAMAPKDAGVAVWFQWDKALRCFAVDRYDDLAQNVQAIYHLIEADRTKMRYGGLEIVRASFKGHIALPAPKRSSANRSWRVVFGYAPDTTPNEAVISTRYRTLAKERANDEAALKELNVARDEALREITQ